MSYLRLIRDSSVGDARRHRFSEALKRRFSQSGMPDDAASRSPQRRCRGRNEVEVLVEPGSVKVTAATTLKMWRSNGRPVSSVGFAKPSYY